MTKDAPRQSSPAEQPGLPGQARTGQPAAVSPMKYEGDPQAWAVAAESKGARFAYWLGVVVLLLVTIFAWYVNAHRDVAQSARKSSHVWSTSVVVLALLLVSASMVALLLAAEHWLWGRLNTGFLGKSSAIIGLWVLRAATALPAGVAVWTAWRGELSWGEARAMCIGLLMISAFVGVVAQSVVFVHDFRTDDVSEPLAVLFQPVAIAPVPDPPHAPRLRAVGASGGGIRAASFVLGGHQALADNADALEIADEEPHVFAVSGGSYIAAALALSRSFDRVTGRPLPTPRPWREAYNEGSAELERLRRHTRYLFEPRNQALDGVFTLLVGAALNLFLAGAALLTLVWISAELSLSLGVVRLVPNGGGEVTDLRMQWHPWVPWLAILIGCAALFLFATVAGWTRSAIYDRTNVITTGQGEFILLRVVKGAPRWLVAHSTGLRVFAGSVAILWIVVGVGLPLLCAGVAQAATDNLPTATGARMLARLGFATDPMCKAAFRDDVDENVREVEAAATANPGAERSVTAGACGAEIQLTRTYDGKTPLRGVPTDAELTQLENYSNLGGASLGGRVTAVLTLLTAALGLLRRGANGESLLASGRFATLRRKLATFVPITAVAAVAIYLAITWFRSMALATTLHPLTATAAVVVAACSMAFLINANGTSMHSFYRARLADAFSVGVTPRPQSVAGQLPEMRLYRFSDLAGNAVEADDTLRSSPEREHGSDLTPPYDKTTPRLHIVATLNTQAHNESPTMRGGFPVVFGAEHVDLYREAGLHIRHDMRDYEKFAGPGRVSIMAAVAISGAAVSPLSGRYAQRLAPYRFLLALFNVRLGTWVRNPAHTPSVGTGAMQHLWSEKPHLGLLWMSRKPGLVQMMLEGFGSSSANRRWVYLSDGGHLDNTGMVEAVRHCLQNGERSRVLVLDASNDAEGSWQAVGEAVAVARADLGVDLVRTKRSELPPWARLYVAPDQPDRSIVEVLVVKAVRAPVPKKNETDWPAVLPADVQSFQATHDDFPRASTARQKFGDLEFEAYRAFGYAATQSALRHAGWTDGTALNAVTSDLMVSDTCHG